MPVFLGRSFLLVPVGQVNLEIIIRAVEKDAAKVPLVMLFVAVVKKLYIFLKLRCLS